MRTYERLGYTLGVIVVFVVLVVGMSRLAHSGADIPVDKHAIVLEYRGGTHNTCLITYFADKSLRCDRIFAGSFL